MRAVMIAIFIAAWIVSFLLALVWVWVVAHFHNSIGLVWTAAAASTITTVLIAVRTVNRADGDDA